MVAKLLTDCINGGAESNIPMPEMIDPGRFHGEAVPGQTICVIRMGGLIASEFHIHS